ncbi:hypothetical protein C8Q79DRAFT_891032, partial [Trametes meyenii]
VELEEVADEDEGGLPRRPWVEDYPDAAGTPGDHVETYFERIHQERAAAQEGRWAPFESQKEWELARWLATSGLSQTAIEKYLQLQI